MNTRRVAGIDEAGRGPLAGPVYAACVVLGAEHGIRGLADSKALSEARRDALAGEIRARAIAWSVARAEVDEVDRLNILQATLLAMRRAFDGIGVPVDEVLVDGNRCPALGVPTCAVVRGDALVAEISAASILAKTARDAEMLRLHAIHPQYGFDRHKGYPTAEHLAALRIHGVSPVHRRSFGPVRALLPNQELST